MKIIGYKIFFLLLLLTPLTISCSKDDDNSLTNGGGNVPVSLVDKTLDLYQSNGSYWMGIYHSTENKATVDLYNGAMVSASYPPTYSYKSSGNYASYSMTFVTQTYVPLYGNYTYSQFSEDITLTFTSSSSGTYSGKQTNMSGSSKNISGTFKITNKWMSY